jgi:hypothetical protein
MRQNWTPSIFSKATDIWKKVKCHMDLIVVYRLVWKIIRHSQYLTRYTRICGMIYNSVRTVTRLRAGRPGFDYRQGLGFQSSPSNAEVTNAWIYTSIPPYIFMAWCLCKLRVRICNRKTCIMVKLSLCFNWAPRHEGVLGSGCIAPLILWPRH